MVGFEQAKQELEGIGAKIVAASIDPIDKAQEVADDVSFPIGYGIDREIGDKLGSFWEERRGLVQPSEFIVGADNKVVVSSYSDGPLGRIDAADVIKLINFYESRK